MTQGQNVERLRAVYLDWAQGNMRAGEELFTPDVIFEQVYAGLAVVVGSDAVADFIREFLGQWSEFRIDAVEFVEVGESILVSERQHAIGRASGVETEMDIYAVWTFRDGLVVKIRWERDRATALAAAGLAR